MNLCGRCCDCVRDLQVDVEFGAPRTGRQRRNVSHSASNLKGAVCGFKSDKRTALELLYGVLRQGNRKQKKMFARGNENDIYTIPSSKPSSTS